MITLRAFKSTNLSCSGTSFASSLSQLRCTFNVLAPQSHQVRRPFSFTVRSACKRPLWTTLHNINHARLLKEPGARFPVSCKIPTYNLRSFSTSPSDHKESKPDENKRVQVGEQVKGVFNKLIDAPLRENIWNVPNVLTMTRIAASPFIGYLIVQEQYQWALGLFAVAGITDMLDGMIARRYNLKTLAGAILDPMADKTLMTILTVTLAVQDLIPVPLAALILGRDAGLVLAAFYYRYISLEPPKTFARYWDFTLPSVEVRPTTISKVNTVLQLALVAASLGSPVFGYTDAFALEALRWTVATTTIWSGASYWYSKDAVRILHKAKDIPK